MSTFESRRTHHDDRIVPSWGFYRRFEGGKLVACNVRLQFPYELKSRCPWLFEISTAMVNPNNSGAGERLTGEETADRRIVSRIEMIGDSLQDAIEGTIGGLVVARRGQEGVWTFYAYLPTSDCKQQLQIAPVREGPVHCQVGVREDPDWEEYYEWLFPHRTMDLMQVFNWEMVNRLRGEGEDLSTPHGVRHFLYLPKREPFEQFCYWARQHGFEVLTDVSPDDMRPKEGEVSLCLERVEPSVGFLELNDAMFAVILETEKLKGRYVECRIIPRAQAS